jgi:hypothetical protein
MRFPSLASAGRHPQASHAVAAAIYIAGRYGSFLASRAQAMRANQLAKATPAMTRWVRDVRRASHALQTGGLLRALLQNGTCPLHEKFSQKSEMNTLGLGLG